MKRFLIYTVLMVGGLTIGWQYLPASTRDKATAFMGTVLRGDKQGIQDFIGNQLLPQDPQQKREALLGILQTKIDELKKQVETNPGVIQNTATKIGSDADNSATALIQQSEDIIQKLQGANVDASVGAKVTDGILNTILPDKTKGMTPGQIKQFCSTNNQ